MKYKIKEGIIIRQVDEDIILYDSEKSIFYGISGALAQYFVNHREFEKAELIAYLIDEYEVDYNTASADIENIISELAQNNVI